MNDILTGIPVAEGVIPDNVESFSDMAMYVIESTEDEFKSVMEDAGIMDENGQYVNESDEEFFNESIGDSIGMVKDAFVDTLQSLWGKIKAFFAKVSKWFAEKAKSAQEFAERQIQKVKDKAEDIRQGHYYKKFKDIKANDITSSDKLGKTHQFTNLENINFSSYVNQATKRIAGSATIYPGADHDNDKEMNLDVLEKHVKSLPGQLCNDNSSVSVSTMKTKIKENCTGESIDVTGKKNFDLEKFKKVVIYNETAKIIKKQYNDARKSITEAIKEVKSDLKKISNKEKKKKEKKIVARKVSAYKSINMILHAAQAALLDVCKVRYNEYMRILVKAARISAKKERKRNKKANASTEFEAMFDF